MITRRSLGDPNHEVATSQTENGRDEEEEEDEENTTRREHGASSKPTSSTSTLSVSQQRDNYLQGWTRFESLRSTGKQYSERDVPWPTGSDLNLFCFPSSAFLDTTTRRKLIRQEYLRWHPDKFKQKFERNFEGTPNAFQNLLPTCHRYRSKIKPNEVPNVTIFYNAHVTIIVIFIYFHVLISISIIIYLKFLRVCVCVSSFWHPSFLHLHLKLAQKTLFGFTHHTKNTILWKKKTRHPTQREEIERKDFVRKSKSY